MSHTLTIHHPCLLMSIRGLNGYTDNRVPTEITGNPWDGDKVHSLTLGMGPRLQGHHGDGVNNIWGHHRMGSPTYGDTIGIGSTTYGDTNKDVTIVYLCMHSNDHRELLSVLVIQCAVNDSWPYWSTAVSDAIQDSGRQESAGESHFVCVGMKFTIRTL